MRSGGQYAYLFCLGLEILLSTVCLGQNAAVIQAIRGNKNHLFVPMAINGQKEFWWLVDTGSPLSMITSQAAMAGALKKPEAKKYSQSRRAGTESRDDLESGLAGIRFRKTTPGDSSARRT